ncbi:MAG: DUF1826 domain-containing protein [Deltaproteobacteria bacterium]|nr:DUF1826 domain-containing protein [Deltaproteobacteria bacterium]
MQSNGVARASAHEARALVTGSTPETLARIRERGIDAAVWRRMLSPELEQWVHLQAATREGEAAIIAQSAEPDLAPVVAFLADEAPRARLLHDVAEIVRTYFSIVRPTRAFVELAIVSDDACRRFHVDRVGYRFLVTYAGPGTEWLPPSRPRSLRPEAASPSEVARARTADVVAVKGDACPDDPGYGLVHRSPPIEQSGSRRLVLRICDGSPRLFDA